MSYGMLQVVQNILCICLKIMCKKYNVSKSLVEMYDGVNKLLDKKKLMDRLIFDKHILHKLNT